MNLLQAARLKDIDLEGKALSLLLPYFTCTIPSSCTNPFSLMLGCASVFGK